LKELLQIRNLRPRAFLLHYQVKAQSCFLGAKFSDLKIKAG